jgi:hypothetical protein
VLLFGLFSSVKSITLLLAVVVLDVPLGIEARFEAGERTLDVTCCGDGNRVFGRMVVGIGPTRLGIFAGSTTTWFLSSATLIVGLFIRFVP